MSSLPKETDTITEEKVTEEVQSTTKTKVTAEKETAREITAADNTVTREKSKNKVVKTRKTNKKKTQPVVSDLVDTKISESAESACDTCCGNCEESDDVDLSFVSSDLVMEAVYLLLDELHNLREEIVRHNKLTLLSLANLDATRLARIQELLDSM